MPQYKVSLIFNQGRLGWSETWYINLSTLQGVKDATNALIKARAALLGQGTIIEAFRIADVAKPRQCGLHSAQGQPLPDLFTDVAWSGILVDVCAGDEEYRRSIIVRGVPDNWIIWDGIEKRFTIPVAASKLFAKWCTQLKTGWQLKVVSKDPPDVNNQAVGVPVAAADGNTNFPIPGTTAEAGQTIRFTDFVGPDKKLLNRRHKVLKVEGGIVTVDLKFDDLTAPGDAGKGKAWHYKYVYRNVTSCEELRPAKKSTGRAFFVPRGRRSVL